MNDVLKIWILLVGLCLWFAKLDIPIVVHAEQAAHAHHDQCIAFLFKLDDLEAQLQHMLVLERRSALGQLRHDDSTSLFAFGLRPPHIHTLLWPFGCVESTKMFPEPREYMRWCNMHFLPPCCRVGHTTRICLILCVDITFIWCTLCV